MYMKHLKTFESYSYEEMTEENLYSEKCADCNCDCDKCDCTDCECKECKKHNVSEKKKAWVPKWAKDKDKKDDEKDEKPVKGKGLTAKQKKLPKAFQAAILKKQGKK